MKKTRVLICLVMAGAVFFAVGTTAFAAESSAREVKGYIWNPQTDELCAYHSVPDAGVLEFKTTEGSDDADALPMLPRGFIRTFHSYSPSTYTYKYDSELFKIGFVRVDNSHNSSEPADLTFTVQNSGSCSTTITSGYAIGGELDAIYYKATLEFSGEVANQVSWSRGMSVGTSTSVPPGQIGKITAYVVGIYSGGTATYAVENTATNQMRYEYVGIGALIPTTNAWNLVVEIPCD